MTIKSSMAVVMIAVTAYPIIDAVIKGYQLYQDRKQPKGVHIDVGPGGLSIQGK